MSTVSALAKDSIRRLVVPLSVEHYHRLLDREKAAVYAQAGIPEYWIVRPAGKQVEVYQTPWDGVYRSVTHHAHPDTLTVLGSALGLRELFD